MDRASSITTVPEALLMMVSTLLCAASPVALLLYLGRRRGALWARELAWCAFCCFWLDKAVLAAVFAAGRPGFAWWSPALALVVLVIGARASYRAANPSDAPVDRDG